MAVLANRDELLVGGRRGMEYDPDMIIDKEIAALLSNGVYPPIFHKFRAIGLYVLRIFCNFTWIYVLVDERIPVDIKTKKPIFGRCRSLNEIWVPMIEKAYAKVYGCYENLISGYVDEGIQELTGFQPEKILIRDEKSGVFPHKMIDQHYGGADGFWDFLMARDNEKCLLGCSIKGYGKEGPLVLEGKNSGLILNHAYSLNDIMEMDDPHNEGQKLRLLRLRNPWGKTEWLGAWSDNSPEIEKYRDLIQEYINTMPPDEQFKMGADDGTFLMNYNDWRDNFSTLFLNVDFPEDWTGVRFRSKWTKSNAAGLPSKYEDEQLERFAKNPQFFIKPFEKTELMFSMTQMGGRLPVDGKYYTYPFKETLQYGTVAVFKLDEGETQLSKFDKDKLVYITPIKREKENSGRIKLEKEKSYVIVCSLEMPRAKGEFFLSVYFD